MQRQGVLAQQIKTWVICLIHMRGPHMGPWKCSATTLTEVGSWDRIRGALQQPHRCLSAPLIGNVPPPLATCLPAPHHCQNDPSFDLDSSRLSWKVPEKLFPLWRASPCSSHWHLQRHGGQTRAPHHQKTRLYNRRVVLPVPTETRERHRNTNGKYKPPPAKELSLTQCLRLWMCPERLVMLQKASLGKEHSYSPLAASSSRQPLQSSSRQIPAQ